MADSEAAIDRGRPSKGRANVRFKTTMHGTVVYQVMLWRGWTEVEDEYDWDIFWADVLSVGVDSNFEHSRLLDKQRLNHFPRHMELTRKDLMVKNLKKFKRQMDRDGNAPTSAFWPQTFRLPEEYGMFVEAFKRVGGLWIMKPVGRCQGRGIFMLDRVGQAAAWKKNNDEREADKKEIYVVSKYIERPLLIGGKKFDMRIYALVLSYSPLKVYMHRGGFCRFSAVRYSCEKDTMKDLFVHLTNVAIQKKGDAYDRESGMKWSLKSLKLYLTSRYGADTVSRLFYGIQMVVMKSLLAVQNVVIQDKHSFELYGYDVMIDEDLRPWLIEVNASPALTTDTAADYQLKFSMVDAALTLVDVEQQFNGSPPLSLNGFDLICSNGQFVQVHPSMPSQLGCDVGLPANLPEKQNRRKLRKDPDT